MQQSQQGDGSTPAGPHVRDNEVWAQMVGSHYMRRIYGMATSHNMLYSLGSVSKARPVGTKLESIRDQVHALNESMQRQLEEADRSTWSCISATRGINSSGRNIYSKQRMTTLYSFYEQMQSGCS